MKVFVATNTLQGERSNDFYFCEEGELLAPPVVICDEFPDDPCGCARCLFGFTSKRGTTTFAVVVLPIDRARFTDIYRTSLIAAGRSSLAESRDLDKVVESLLGWAELFDEGDVVERRESYQRRGRVTDYYLPRLRQRAVDGLPRAA